MENYKLKVEVATKVYRVRRIARIIRVGKAFGVNFQFDKKIKAEIAGAAGSPADAVNVGQV
jgi:hypothetical protein